MRRAEAAPDWIAEHWTPDLPLAEWWARLFDAGYAFPSWPEGLGGWGATAAEARTVSAALAAAGVVGPAQRQRPEHGWADRHPARHARTAAAVRRTDGPRHRAVVPAVQRAGCRLRPREPRHEGRARRRRVRHHRPEGVELEGRRERVGHAAVPHRPRRAEASRAVVRDARHAPARRRGATAGADERRRRVLRGVPHRGAGPGGRRHRRRERRLERGPHHAAPRAGVGRGRQGPRHGHRRSGRRRRQPRAPGRRADRPGEAGDARSHQAHRAAAQLALDARARGRHRRSARPGTPRPADAVPRAQRGVPPERPARPRPREGAGGVPARRVDRQARPRDARPRVARPVAVDARRRVDAARRRVPAITAACSAPACRASSRRSAAAPTRSSATSSPNARSASPASRRTTTTCRSGSCAGHEHETGRSASPTTRSGRSSPTPTPGS